MRPSTKLSGRVRERVKKKIPQKFVQKFVNKIPTYGLGEAVADECLCSHVCIANLVVRPRAMMSVYFFD